MKTFGLAAAIVTLCVFPSWAQDGAVRHDWSGISAGVFGGWGDGDARYQNIGSNAVNDSGIDGTVVGARIGYRQQFDFIVAGVAGSASFADVSGRSSQFNQAEFDVDWIATLDAQLGVTNGLALLYVTGGFAASGIQHDYYSGTIGGFDHSFNRETHTGVSIGLGAEFKLTDAWSMWGEFRHYRFDEESFEQVGDIIAHNVDADFETVTFGINYSF